MKQYAFTVLIAGLFLSGAEADMVDYSDYAATLEAYVDDEGWVNYKDLKANRGKLDSAVEAMGAVTEEEYKSWEDAVQIAFWINAYNAITLQRIIDNYPIKPGGIIDRVRFPSNSIRQIDGVWKEITTTVVGKTLTLDVIEHSILREHFDEPRIHMALVCAAQSCPPLRNEPFRGDSLDEQLNDQTRRFLSREANFGISAKGDVTLSSIFDWFGSDFTSKYAPKEGISGHKGAEAAVLNFVSQHVNDEDAKVLKAGNFKVKYSDYDWTLNEQ